MENLELLEKIKKLESENEKLKEEKKRKEYVEYSLLGFNQEKLLATYKKIIPAHYLFLLKKLMDMRGYDGMDKKIIDNKTYFWLKTDMPMKIFPYYIRTIRASRDILTKLEEYGFIEKHSESKKDNKGGTYVYIHVTKKAEELKNEYVQVAENIDDGGQLHSDVTGGLHCDVTGQLHSDVTQRPYTKVYPMQKDNSLLANSGSKKNFEKRTKIKTILDQNNIGFKKNKFEIFIKEGHKWGITTIQKKIDYALKLGIEKSHLGSFLINHASKSVAAFEIAATEYPYRKIKKKEKQNTNIQKKDKSNKKYTGDNIEKLKAAEKINDEPKKTLSELEKKKNLVIKKLMNSNNTKGISKLAVINDLDKLNNFIKENSIEF